MEMGINKQLNLSIKEMALKWSKSEKYCSIIFDELPIENAPKSNYETAGSEQLEEKPDKYALVFLLRGATSKWKQPFALYISDVATPAEQMKILIKEIVLAVVETGLLPIALITNQEDSFQSAIKSLQEDTREWQIRAGIERDNTIVLGGMTLSVIYDPVQLLKGTRNSFLCNDIMFEDKRCTWKDIVEVYILAHKTILVTLNEEDVIPEKINKTKVNNCVRVFSKRMAGVLSFTSSFGTKANDGKGVSPTMKNTCHVVLFFDQLFDSVTGFNKFVENNSLRRAVTPISRHHMFWNEAKEKLKNMKFIDNDGKERLDPILDNWITTVESFQRLWKF